MDEIFRPHRRTTTITYHGCGNLSALLSPPTLEEMYELLDRFVQTLQAAGFTVTKREETSLSDIGREFKQLIFGGCHAGRVRVQEYDTSFHRFWEPGREYGYTMGAVLSGSDASVHTYPEPGYGRAFEVEFNLCYLNPLMEQQHERSLRSIVPLLGFWLRQTGEPDIEPSSIRDFRPIAA